jgi:hypothetical protein
MKKIVLLLGSAGLIGVAVLILFAFTNNPGKSSNPEKSTEIDEKITICHYPPGNTTNPQTISISQSAWPAHCAHGDTRGCCPQ